jgi:glycosyltransferase involved in cell wall biosynthesis
MGPGSLENEAKSSSDRVRHVLLYVNHVYPDDLTGQGTFERELVAALRRRVDQSDSSLLRVFTVRRPQDPPPTPRADTTMLPLDKSSKASYVGHQFQLMLALGQALVRYRNDQVTVYVRYSPSSIAPVLLSTLFRRRLVIRAGPALRDTATLHKHGGRLLKRLVWLGFGWNCWKANPLIVVAEQTKRTIAGWYPFVANKTVIVPNGANTDQFRRLPADRARWGLSPHGMVLGFVGHLLEYQGLDTVLRALGKIQKESGDAPQLLAVGDGPLMGAWQKLAEDLGLGSRVVFAGGRPFSEIPSAINACDVMVAPFTGRKFAVSGSSALKVFEYLACDKPVLATRAGDHEFLREAGVGWLVEPDDVAAWAEAIRSRMADPAFSLGGRGRRLAEERFSFTRVAERIWSACFQPALARNEIGEPPAELADQAC